MKQLLGYEYSSHILSKRTLAELDPGIGFVLQSVFARSKACVCVCVRISFRASVRKSITSPYCVVYQAAYYAASVGALLDCHGTDLFVLVFG
jgi:hypothetical protein